MKRKLYILFAAALLLLGLPGCVFASAWDEEAAPELYDMELNESYLVLSRPGKAKTLKVDSYYETDYPFSGVTWSSDDTSVARVTSSGKVTAVGRGFCTITATAKDDPSVTAECEVCVEKYAVTYHYKNGDEDKTSYYDGQDEVILKSPKRSGYIFAGWYKDKSYSKRITKIKCDNTANYELYAKWSKVKKPGKPTIRLSSTSAKKLKVTLKKKVKGADGYEIVAAKNKALTSGKKTAVMTGTTKTLSGLTAGAKYFVKVRAYTSDSTGKKIYGSYSALGSITVKKAIKRTPGNEDTVYITKTGDKYHRSGCRYLRQSKIAISRAEAIRQGYTACKVCKP